MLWYGSYICGLVWYSSYIFSMECMESILRILYLQHDMVWLLHFQHGIGIVVCGWYIFSVVAILSTWFGLVDIFSVLELNWLLHFLKCFGTFDVFSVLELDWMLYFQDWLLHFRIWLLHVFICLMYFQFSSWTGCCPRLAELSHSLRSARRRRDMTQPPSATDFPHKTTPSPADQMLKFGQETMCSKGTSRCTSRESIFQVFFGHFRAFLGDV